MGANTNRIAWYWLAVAMISILAAGLRSYDLSKPSLWIDEVYTVRSAANLNTDATAKILGYLPSAVVLRALGVPMHDISMDNVHEWRSLGLVEWRMRFTAVLFGIITFPLIAIAGRRALGDRVCLTLLVLLAVAPWHIWMSQSARFYSQQFLFASLSLLWFLHATSKGSHRSMALSMCCLVLAFLTQPPALVLVGVFAMDWLIGLARGKPIRLGTSGWVMAVIAMGICMAALGIDITRRTQEWSEFSEDRDPNMITLLLGPIWMIGPVTVIFAAWAVMLHWKDQPRQAMYWLLAGIVPILGLLAASFGMYVHLRYMFIGLFGWLVLAALGADRLALITSKQYGRIASFGVLAMLITSSMMANYAYFTDGYGYRSRWRDAFDYVQRHRQPGDLVASGIKAHYYLEESDIVRLHRVEGFDDLVTDNRPVWVVFRAASPSTPRSYRWLDDTCEFKATFDSRVQEPFSSVRVYYCEPCNEFKVD